MAKKKKHRQFEKLVIERNTQHQIPAFPLRSKKIWFFTLFFMLLILIAYFNTLGNKFVSDDTGVAQLKEGLPLSFFLNPPLRISRNIFIYLAYISGNSPLPYHLINISFHVFTTWTVFYLIATISGLIPAFFAASLLAIHPAISEAVTWISGGVYVQYSFFLLVAFFFYIKRHKKRSFLLLSILFYFFSLSTAPDKAIIFPLIVLMYELSCRNLRRNFIITLPYWILTIFVLGYYFISGQVAGRFSDIETTFYQQSGIDNILITIPTAISSYLGLFLWPKTLTLYHSELVLSIWQYLFHLSIFTCFVIALIYSWFKNRQIFFWLSFFLVSLLPTLTPLRISWLVAERYSYLGAVGLFSVAGIFLDKLVRQERLKNITLTLFTLVLILLIMRTIIRNTEWKDQDALFLSLGRTAPSDPKTHNNLGDTWARRGDFQRSIDEFNKAIKINPRYADAMHNLATVYQQTGENKLAIDWYEKAFSINPALWQSQQNIAAIYFSQKKFQLAEVHMKKAISVNSQSAPLYSNLGTILFYSGKKSEAKNAFEKALSLDPEEPRARLGLNQLKGSSN